ncbi:hypothetical protein SAMN05892883_0553 [Jatrophihabitans sp. GAS493]|uniref:YciI family protein n=1 Tax=Jatrophihabitans sp. GAS493 TaxID=1907575 RepID=UPI000BB88BD4|nr:YciI family protein [Jatrophihabitans sp. GAS493]SOD70930.1 hypothetical protein SAMN05892883_0553 [Jatrophihabitans sp. GAS493]
MEFDRFSVALLVLRDDAPELDEQAAGELQDAHMAHLASMHVSGAAVAGGPLRHGTFRGLTILTVDPDEARRLAEADPAVQAGRFRVEILPWMVPGGAMSFSNTFFPRSRADVS